MEAEKPQVPDIDDDLPALDASPPPVAEVPPELPADTFTPNDSATTNVDDPLESANFELIGDFSTPMTGEVAALERVLLPAARREAAIKRLGEFGGGALDDTLNEYAEKFGVASTTEVANGLFSDALDRSGAAWTNEPKFEGRSLKGGWPAQKNVTANTPEAARALVRSGLKMSNWFTAPLWHSGFWIHLRAPSESSLLELYHRIAVERSVIGRQTYGTMFSNHRVFSSLAIADFVQEHLYGTSLIAPAENFNLMEHVSMLDLPSIAWALAAASFPAGFQYDRTCCVNPATCRHTVHARLNLSRLLMVDKTRFNDDQLRQMSKRERNSVTVEQLKTYRDASTFSNQRDFALNESVTITLAVPTIQEHFNSGLAWSSHIEKTYGSALNFDEKDREKYMRTQANTMMLRDIGHLIKKITVNGIEIVGNELIEPSLNDISSQPHLVEKIKKAAEAYLNDLASALIAIPTYDCPACLKPQPTTSKRYSELIPLDVISTFFYLLYQKQARHQA